MNCPQKYYSENNFCKLCYSTCLTCNSQESTGCFICKVGLYLKKVNLLSNGECLGTCPSGNYSD